MVGPRPRRLSLAEVGALTKGIGTLYGRMSRSKRAQLASALTSSNIGSRSLMCYLLEAGHLLAIDGSGLQACRASSLDG